jgi:hypothetical protein
MQAIHDMTRKPSEDRSHVPFLLFPTLVSRVAESIFSEPAKVCFVESSSTRPAFENLTLYRLLENA